MNKKQDLAVIKYVQKKSMTPTEIHEDMGQAFAEHSPSYAIELDCGIQVRQEQHRNLY